MLAWQVRAPTAAHWLHTELGRLLRQRPQKPREESATGSVLVALMYLGCQLFILSGFISMYIHYCCYLYFSYYNGELKWFFWFKTAPPNTVFLRK